MLSLNAPEQLCKSPWHENDPGNGGLIQARKQFQISALAVAASVSETRTVEHPTKAGLIVTICAMSVGGGGSVTITDSDGASAFDAGGDTSFSFSVAGDFVTLISVPASSTTFRWQVLQSGGSGIGGITNNPEGAHSVSTLTSSGLATLASLKVTGGAGFYNTTPVASKPAGAAQATITDGSGGTANPTTGVATISDTATKNAIATIIAQTNAIQTALVSLGLIKGAA